MKSGMLRYPKQIEGFVVRVTFFGFTAYYLLQGISLANQHDPQSAIVCIGGAALLFLLMHMDKLSSLKGFGIEAKVRELDARIVQADELLEHMRVLSKTMGQITFETLARIGRRSGPPSRAWQLEVAKSLKGHMEEIGIDPLAIEDAMEPWHKINLHDISVPIYNAVFETLREHQLKWENEQSSYPVPLAADDRKYQDIVAMIKLYGNLLSELREHWERNTAIFVKNAEEIITSLEGVSADVKQALLERTAADRKSAAYYAQHHQFLSEAKWLLDQPQ